MKHSAATGQPANVVFVLGCPGAGKGTLCQRLANDLGWYHLSVGDYLRDLSRAPSLAQAGDGTLSQSQLQSMLQARTLLSPATITAIVADKIEQERTRGWQSFLVDGFPRQAEAASLFEQTVVRPLSVFLFDCPHDIAKARFVSRKRGDDDAEIFEKRYKEYQEKNAEILAWYGGIVKTLETGGEQEETYQGLLSIADDLPANANAL